jgi:large conductance mechanosensitive channel
MQYKRVKLYRREKLMGFLKDFKTFALKGNVMDMAVGVIIGGAFSKIVTSLVNDILMPPLGMLLGKVNFAELSYTLKEATVVDGKDVPAVVLKYGAFIQQVIDFAILAFCVFIMVKIMTRLIENREKKAAEPAPAPAPEPPKPSNEEVLLTEIRDLLKEKK